VKRAFEIAAAETSCLTLNPACFNNTLSKSAPQFISIELRTQGADATVLKALRVFETNLDLDKLQALLAK
jgi:hypothetical protein